MLDLQHGHKGPAPKDAATLILVRDGGAGGIEVFCVERNRRSAFVGGAIVFPGGKLDPADLDPRWQECTTRTHPLAAGRAPIAASEDVARGLAIAACREALEEAAILPVQGGLLGHDDLLELRRALAASELTLLEALVQRGLLMDLLALHPFARWVTPEAETRRYDTRFYLAAAPAGQPGAHDEHETTASFWAAPQDVLARFAAGTVLLAPPTHRTLELLATCSDARAAVTLAAGLRLEIVCPLLVRQLEEAGETLALTLPGDPEHPVPDRLLPGSSRFVLRDTKWLPEDAPSSVDRREVP